MKDFLFRSRDSNLRRVPPVEYEAREELCADGPLTRGLVWRAVSEENSTNHALIDRRYRALLDVSSAMVEQPTVKAVLHSWRGVLSSSCRLHGTDLYILDSGGEKLNLLEFDRETDAPAIKTGTRISRIGVAAQVLEKQEPVFLSDVSKEMLKHPELAPFAAQSVGRSAYLFPVSTSQQRYGICVV